MSYLEVGTENMLRNFNLHVKMFSDLHINRHQIFLRFSCICFLKVLSPSKRLKTVVSTEHEKIHKCSINATLFLVCLFMWNRTIRTNPVAVIRECICEHICS